MTTSTTPMRSPALRFAVLVVVGGLAGRTVAQGEAVWKFDFTVAGAGDQSVWRDFIAVDRDDRYTQDTGYGFEMGAAGRALEVERQDPLAADSVRLSGHFRVDVDPGSYWVYALVGSPGRGYDQLPVADRLTYGLSIQGEQVRAAEVFDPQQYLDYVYTGVDRDYVPGEDWYELFVRPLFDEYRVAVDAPDGRIVITGDRAWIAGLVIFPGGGQAAFDGFVDRLSSDREAHLRDAVSFRAPEEIDDQIPAPVTAEEARRGYRLWWRHPLRNVYPATEPEAHELGDGEAFAARGETESITLALRALRPMAGIRLVASDLRAEDGSVMPASAFEVEVVKYCYGFPQAAYGDDCTIVPGYLRPAGTPFDVPSGLTRQFWIRINVPDSAKSGTYHGSFRLEGDGLAAGEAALHLTVLPFELTDAYDCADFYYGGPTMALWHRLPGMEDLVEPEVERMLRFMSCYDLAPSLGYDLFSYVQGETVALGTPQQHIEYDVDSVEGFKRVMQLYLDILPRSRPLYVLNHVVSIWSTVVPWVRDDRKWQVSDQPEAVWLALKQYLAEMQALQQETGAPPFRYLLGFEETNGGRDNILWDARLLERVKEWYPDLERVTTAITPYEARMEAPQASLLCTPGHVVPFDDLAYRPTDTPAPRRAVYQPDHRFSYGFFLAAVGGEFTYREHFAMAAGNPFNAFDGIDQCTSFPYAAMPGPGGLLPTVMLENCREGIDDYRYIKTLEESIRQAKEGPEGAAAGAAEADEFLRLLLGSIDPDGNHYVNEAGYWDPEVFDHYRWEIAKRIETLRKRAL